MTAKVAFTSTNIHARFREAMRKLRKADPDLDDFARSFTEEEWYRFVSHMSGFVISSLMNSEPAPEDSDCNCERCQVERFGICRFMPSHPDGCGNKRCPASQWHGYKCTNSNEPDQVPELAEEATDE